MNENEKVDLLLSITEGKARTVVLNSLGKSTPDNYNTIINNLKVYFDKTSSKNTRILELSSITIKKDESISDFDLRFLGLLNEASKTITIDDVIITSYYINAFRNWKKIYENLMEAEPVTLEAAMKVTSKKEKILNIINQNKVSKTSVTVEKHKDNSNKNNKTFIPNNSFQNFKMKTAYNTENNILRNKNFNQNSFYNKNQFYKENINNKIEERRKSLRPTMNNDELKEITQKLSDLKINFCMNCKRIGHQIEDCNELRSDDKIHDKNLN